MAASFAVETEVDQLPAGLGEAKLAGRGRQGHDATGPAGAQPATSGCFGQHQIIVPVPQAPLLGRVSQGERVHFSDVLPIIRGEAVTPVQRSVLCASSQRSDARPLPAARCPRPAPSPKVSRLAGY